MVNDLGYLAIVITNQPVIARGEATEQELDAIHAKLEMELGKKGAYIDGLFYCHHHPDSGFAGERAELKIKCGCRKPAPGLILEAANKYNIDLVESWMIGDSITDMECGKNAGTGTFLVKSDKNLYAQIESLSLNKRTIAAMRQSGN
jgi:D-glycero-D-manno-heptose 1,7-bisphosphate phosphatase